MNLTSIDSVNSKRTRKITMTPPNNPRRKHEERLGCFGKLEKETIIKIISYLNEKEIWRVLLVNKFTLNICLKSLNVNKRRYNEELKHRRELACRKKNKQKQKSDNNTLFDTLYRILNSDDLQQKPINEILDSFADYFHKYLANEGQEGNSGNFQQKRLNLGHEINGFIKTLLPLINEVNERREFYAFEILMFLLEEYGDFFAFYCHVVNTDNINKNKSHECLIEKSIAIRVNKMKQCDRYTQNLENLWKKLLEVRPSFSFYEARVHQVTGKKKDENCCIIQ